MVDKIADPFIDLAHCAGVDTGEGNAEFGQSRPDPGGAVVGCQDERCLGRVHGAVDVI